MGLAERMGAPPVVLSPKDVTRVQSMQFFVLCSGQRLSKTWRAEEERVAGFLVGFSTGFLV